MKTASARLSNIPEIFRPLRDHAERYLHFGATLDEAAVISIGPNPKVAPLYFVFRIFPPAVPDWLIRHRTYEVPIEYLRFLACTNGCFAYGLSLFGFTPSMQSDPPLLHRTILQCHDLTTANETWRREYQRSTGCLHFGSRHYSYTEIVGYFMDEFGGIASYLKSGREVQRWENFTSFLQDELRPTMGPKIRNDKTLDRHCQAG